MEKRMSKHFHKLELQHKIYRGILKLFSKYITDLFFHRMISANSVNKMHNQV